MIEDFFNALKNFKQNKVRTLLSLLGVIIGVASVIVITTVGASASAKIMNSFGSAGLDLVTVMSGGMRSSRNTFVMNDALRQKVFDSIEDINAIYYKNTLQGTLLKDELDVSVAVNAIEYGFMDAQSLEIDYGATFSVSDFVHGSQNIILGSETAAALFPQGNAIGENLILDSSGIKFGFTVIGVLKTLTNMVETPDSAAYVPREFYIKKIAPNPNASTMTIQVTSEKVVTAINNAMTAFIEKETGNPYAANVFSMTTMLEHFQETNKTMNMLLTGIAAISLLVGGIGIMNIMIVTVTERKKEIGIRKALGATPNAIRSQFLVESATISLLGGFFGILVGLIISAIVAYILTWPFIADWFTVFGSFIFSAGVGVFFGLSPASRAAKLNPVDALASE
ncbi:MAG: ABC transporter permease [Treponemataceae bacterium]